MNYETFKHFEDAYYSMETKLDALSYALQEFEWKTSTSDPDHPFDPNWMKEIKLVEILADLEELKTEYEQMKVDALNILNVQEEYKVKIKNKCELFQDLLVIFKSLYGNIPPSEEYGDSRPENGECASGSYENLDRRDEMLEENRNSSTSYKEDSVAKSDSICDAD